MTDFHSTPEQIRNAMGWDFNSNTSLEALAAWEEYKALPINADWDGMEKLASERDAFTAGFDARTKGNDDDEMARMWLDFAKDFRNNQLLRDNARTLALTYSNLANAKAMNGRAL